MTPPAHVLLHGFTGHATSWDAVAPLLPSGARVFRPSLFGHDAALRSLALHRFDEEVDRLAAVVRAEGLVGARVCGYSMGGRVALGMLVRHPGLFSSAVLIGAHLGLATEVARRARVAADERWARLLEEEGIERFVAEWAALPLFATQGALPDEAARAHRARRLAHDPAELARALRVLGLGAMPPRLEALSGVQVPVCLVVGEHDGKLGAVARIAREHLPRSTVRVVAGAGHDVVLERPRELAALLAEEAPWSAP